MPEDILSRPFPILEKVPHPLAFVTLVGSHLYGFATPESDFDLRGVHILTARELLGLGTLRETFDEKDYIGGRVDTEIVTHDVFKYFRLLLRNNGCCLEQIFSPLIIIEGILPHLQPIAERCITRHSYNYYSNYAKSEWTQFYRYEERPVKRILYVFRLLMTGIHLMRTGKVESNINVLNDTFKLSYIPELIQEKLEGQENPELAAGHALGFYQREYDRMASTLENEFANSKLLNYASGYDDLNTLLLELRGV